MNKLIRTYNIIPRKHDGSYPLSFQELAVKLNNDDLLAVVQAVLHGETHIQVKSDSIHSIEWTRDSVA